MRRTLTLGLSLLTLAACHSSSDPLQQAQDLDAQADAQLAQGHIAAANGLYGQALAALATDSHAGSGAALTALLALPDSKPVTDLLDQCGQPHFDVEHQVFGAAGTLAQAAQARAGTSTVQLHVQSAPGAAFASVPFTAKRVRTTYYPASGTSSSDISVFVSNEDPDNTNGPQYVSLSFYPDDLYSSDSVVTPLTDGTTIDLAQHPDFYVSVETSGGYFYTSGTGTIVFHGSPTSGSAVKIDFNAVQLAQCQGCAAVQVDGEIDSTLVPRVEIPAAKRPFGTFAYQSTPVIRPQLVGELEACGASLSTDELTQKLSAISPLLDDIRAKLDAVLAGPAADAKFTLPKGLLQTREDLPLNRADLQAVRSLVHLGRAAIALAIRYRYLATPFEQLIGDQPYWTYDTSNALVETTAHDFLRQPLATDLNANFLTVADASSLTTVQSELDAALADLDAVLTSAAGTSGFLDLHNARSTPLAAQLDDDVKALRASLGGLQTVPRNPGYGVNLKAFLSAPPDRQVLLARAGLSGLFTYVPGDPDGGTAYDRNDRIDTASPADIYALSTWSGGTFTLPVDGSATTCIGNSDCPAGNSCGGTGACYVNDFSLLTPSVNSDLSKYGTKELLSSAAADLQDLLDQ